MADEAKDTAVKEEKPAVDESPTVKEEAKKSAEPKGVDAKGTKDEKAEADAEAPDKKPKKKKAKRNVPAGNVYVLASFNNTIITVTDPKGNTLTAASAGAGGFRGSKKGTAYAAQVAAERAIATAKQDFGVSTVNVYVKGVGLGRDAAIRTLIAQRVNVENIKDVTGLPHGGVRPRRPKRN